MVLARAVFGETREYDLVARRRSVRLEEAIGSLRNLRIGGELFDLYHVVGRFVGVGDLQVDDFNFSAAEGEMHFLHIYFRAGAGGDGCLKAFL